jgi:sulfatase modifying factor 1
VQLIRGAPGAGLLVWRPGEAGWACWSDVPVLASAVAATGRDPAPSPRADGSATQAARIPGARRRVRLPGPAAADFEMAWLPSGSFRMGSPLHEDGRFEDEVLHTVRLRRAIEIGVVPVTQDLYHSLVGTHPSEFVGGSRPVERIAWLDAVRFCNLLSGALGLPPAYDIGPEAASAVRWDRASVGFRLPTEAEWEYAARAGTAMRYAGSDDVDTVAWTQRNSRGATWPVGRAKANAWGLHDLSGNVWEWCWDWMGPYPQGDAVDPAGPDAGSSRVGRGGCWLGPARYARVAVRYGGKPTFSAGNIGFRLARFVE